MLIKILFIVIIGIALVLPPPAPAQDVPSGRWWRNPRISRHLNLNDREIDRLDAVYVKSRRKLIREKSSLEAERFELENIIENRALDEGAAIQQFDRLESKRENLSRSRFNFLLEVRKILGPDRFQNLKSLYQRSRDPKRVLNKRRQRID